VTYFEVADEATLRILEAEENVRRKDMTWQEVVLAVKAVHEAQTVTHSLKGEKWTLDATGYLLGKSQGNVSYCLLLANHINAKDKQILAASSLTEAIRVLLKRKEDEANAILAKMTMPKGTQTADILKADLSKQGSAASIFSDIPSSPVGGVATLSDDGEMPSVEGQAPVEIPLSKMLLHGDCISLMKQMPDACVDHIITDIPYGIDMDNLQQANTGMTDIASVAVEHQVLANHQLHVAMLPEFYRLLKPNGFCIMWFDVGASEQEDSQDQGYLNLRLIATGAGFRCQNWPLVWHKLHRCMNQMAGYNFTKDYELALCCRKGNATLLASQESSVYVGSNDEEAKALGHKFAKPLKLWDWLYRAVVQRGQTVLDPFAGRGSSTISLLRYGASPLAIEKDDNHFSGLVVNVSKEYQKMLKTVKFT
jgi:DNA modification methylase